MIVIARSFTGKIWAGSEVFTMADNHVVSVSSDELEEERRHLNAHTARVGVEPFSVGEALDFAAQWICSHTRLKTKARLSLRRLVAYLLAWRLLRKSDLLAVRKRAKSHLERYDRIRTGLVKEGIPKESIKKLSSGIANLTQGLEERKR